LEANGSEVTLVDRQPQQGVLRHAACAVEDFMGDRTFKTAIVDPPWYPTQLQTWAQIAGHAVGVGGTVLLSVWPESTRPAAVTELEATLNGMASWALIERNVDELSYIEPLFESIARNVAGDRSLSRSPLKGELVQLRVKQRPPAKAPSKLKWLWHRFIVNDYQLAVRIGERAGFNGMRKVSEADGWLWPFVSARAPGIDYISIWSSEGEVGMIGDPNSVVAMIRAAFSSTDSKSFERALTEVPELLNWHLPRPPYWRLIEWQHRQ
jgi:hypothetical protein